MKCEAAFLILFYSWNVCTCATVSIDCIDRRFCK